MDPDAEEDGGCLNPDTEGDGGCLDPDTEEDGGCLDSNEVGFMEVVKVGGFAAK